MVGPFALDGYDVIAPLSASGRRWRAVCLADGRRVVLRRCVGAATSLADARRRAAVWGSVAGAGVVPVRDVVVVGDDLIVVSELAAGGGLDVLLARCGSLSPGQIVTLVVPISQTLAALHDRDLAHGHITAASVVLDGDGRPLLTDWAMAGEGDPSTDLAALVGLASRCLASDSSPVVETLLANARDLRELGQQLLSAAPAEPLSIAEPAVVAAVPEQTAGAAARGFIRGGVAVGLAVAVALGAGVLWGHRDAPAGGATLSPPTPTADATPTMDATPTSGVGPTSGVRPTSTAAAADWRDVVRTLERERVQALLDGDTARLARSEVRGSAQWRRDVPVLARLRSARLHLRGLRATVESAHVQSVQPDRVVVRVVDALSSYAVVDAREHVLARRPARPLRAVQMVLRRGDDGWLIGRVSRRAR